MKPTHQILIEKIMEAFKEQEDKGQSLPDMITKSKIEHVYNQFLEELEEPTNEAASLETEITGTVDKIVDEIQSLHGLVWDGNSSSVAERGYESVKKLITAVQDNAIQENRKMIRELQELYDKLGANMLSWDEDITNNIKSNKRFINFIADYLIYAFSSNSFGKMDKKRKEELINLMNNG